MLLRVDTNLRTTTWLLLAAVCVAGCANIDLRPGAQGQANYAEQGLASYYSDYHQGRKTASGEPFDQAAMTAAHPSLAFGTRVRVTRIDTGRDVVVRINDRGPFVPGRIIDLSYAAAEKLDMLDSGVAQVRVSVE